MKIRTIGVAAVLVLTLGACGSGDTDSASKGIADAIMDSDVDALKVTQEQADCVGDGMAEKIGPDQLVEYGILDEEYQASDGLDSVEMSEEDAESAADVMQDCADIMDIFASAMSELPEEAQACIEDRLTDDVLHDFLVAGFRNDQEGGTASLTGALTECIASAG